MYLLLRKLKADGLVTTYLQEASGGPPRKFYKLTQLGEVVWRPARRSGPGSQPVRERKYISGCQCGILVLSAKIMRAADCNSFVGKPRGFSGSQSSPAGSFPGRAAFFIFI